MEKLNNAMESIKKGAAKAAKDIKKAGGEVITWVKDHPIESATIATATCGTVSKGYKLYKAYDENKRRKRMFYDPRTHRWSEARRDLKWYENNAIDDRYASGESYHHILGDMGLLK